MEEKKFFEEVLYLCSDLILSGNTFLMFGLLKRNHGEKKSWTLKKQLKNTRWQPANSV